jgi:outer membrane protein
MMNRKAYFFLHKLAVTSLVGALSAQLAFAQTPPVQQPAQKPPVSPSQQDATRPPGTQNNQPIPPNARPTTQDPTAPPGVNSPAPTAPPGTVNAPQTGTPTQPSTVTPLQTPGTPNTQQPSELNGAQAPTLPNVQARPIPPIPDLTRLGVDSGNKIPLSLNDAVRRALENNNTIEVARNDVRIQEQNLRSLEGVYEPVFSVTPQINNQVSAQQSTLGGATGAGTVSQTDIQLNPSVGKLFSTGGGSYNFFFNNNRRTTDSTFNTLNPVYSSSLGVQLTQPLWRDRSIDSNRRLIRVQKKTLQQSDADFRRTTIDVIQQVQRAYWDLVFAVKDLDNRVSNLNLTRENLRRVEAQIAAGSSAPIERAEVETELANRESDLLLASQNISIAENNLKQLIIKDPNAPEWTAQLAPTDAPIFDSKPINMNDALEEARKNRPELQRLQLQDDISNIDIQFFKNQTKPRVDLVATTALTGLSGSPVFQTSSGPIIGTNINTNASAFLLNQINVINQRLGFPVATSPIVSSTTSAAPSNLSGGYFRDLGNLFGGSTRSVVVGVSIQFPFKNKTAEANLAAAKYQQTQLQASTRLQEQTIEAEVRNAVQNVETSRRVILTARTARENAEIQLQGEQRLYQVGRSTTFLLFQREDTLATARNAEIRAETSYAKALADLQRATSTTLRANNVVVEVRQAP